MKTTPNPHHAALHDADADMRRAWQAFAYAYAARRDAGLVLNARIGTLTLDNSWGDMTLLGQMSTKIDGLPRGEALDVAIGNAILRERAHAEAKAEQEREQAAADERTHAARAKILAELNRRPDEVEAARRRALAAVHGAS